MKIVHNDVSERQGHSRIVTKFIIFPKTLQTKNSDQTVTRFLEKVEIHQECIIKHDTFRDRPIEVWEDYYWV